MKSFLPVLLITFFLTVSCALAQASTEGDNIIIRKNGKLQLIDQNGSKIKSLNIKEKVFSFRWAAPELLFYTTLKNNTLELYAYSLQIDSSTKTSSLKKSGKNKYFWGDESMNSIRVKEGKVFIGCDYQEEGEERYFARVYVVEISSQKATLTTEMGLLAAPRVYNSSQLDVKNSLSVKSDCELYYNNGDEVIKVSNTPYEKMREEGNNCILYDISPNGEKVVFSTMQEMGEFPENKLFIVNTDGTNQVKIADASYPFIGCASLTTGYSYFQVNDLNLGQPVLYAFTDMNKRVQIAKGFDTFQLCSYASYEYFFLYR